MKWWIATPNPSVEAPCRCVRLTSNVRQETVLGWNLPVASAWETRGDVSAGTPVAGQERTPANTKWRIDMKWVIAIVLLLALAVIGAGWWLRHVPSGAGAPLPQVSTGRMERMVDFPSLFVPPRNVDVWLPDGYPGAGRYDVLYMHDGQMLFDAATTWNKQEWRVDEVAGDLIKAGRTRPFIVVGIWNAGRTRGAEYFPRKPWEALTDDERRTFTRRSIPPLEAWLGPPIRSDAYLRFLVEELKPEIDRRYATEPGRENTFVMGSSMGGLISMSALLEYPAVFGGAACLSTHWPGGDPTASPNPVPARFFAYLRETLPAPGRHRIWFDHGTETLDRWYPPLQREVDAVMRARGWREPDWVTRAYVGADHSEKSWAARLEEPLTFLLGARTAPAADDATPKP